MPSGRLSGPELKIVRDAIDQAFVLREFEALLEDYVDVRLDKYITVTSQPFPDILRIVVRGLDLDNRLDKMIEAAIEVRPNDPKVKALRSFISVPLEPAADPYDVGSLYLMDASLPFFDRGTLRRELRPLGDGQRRTLLINGDHCSGKTYTLYLFDFVARTSGRFEFIYCDLRRLVAGGRVPPERLARHITEPMQLGEALPSRGPEKPEAWAADFAVWLEGRLRKGEQTYWVMIDHCRAALLDQGSEDLLVNLASRAETLDRLRLILVDYEGIVTLRSLRLKRVGEELVQPVTEEHVRDFFSSVHRYRRKQAGETAVPGVDDPDVQESIRNTWQQIDPDDEEWLVSLGKRVEIELGRILR